MKTEAKKLADAQRVRFGVLASRQDSQFFVETIQNEDDKKGASEPALATGQASIF